MNAVRTDDDVHRDPCAVGKRHDSLVLVLLKASAPVARIDCFRRQSVNQHLQEVRPVNAVDLDGLLGARRPPARDGPAVGVTKLGIGPPRTSSRRAPRTAASGQTVFVERIPNSLSRQYIGATFATVA